MKNVRTDIQNGNPIIQWIRIEYKIHTLYKIYTIVKYYMYLKWLSGLLCRYYTNHLFFHIIF